MHLIWLFEIRGHFCKKFIGGDADIYGKAEFCTDLILQLMGSCHRIRVNIGGSGHIQKNLINGKGFHYRCIGPTDFFEGSGTFIV